MASRSPAADITSEVEIHPLVKILYIISSTDLPETSDARFHRELLLLKFSEMNIFTDQRWSGAQRGSYLRMSTL